MKYDFLKSAVTVAQLFKHLLHRIESYAFVVSGVKC
jgi:hypothetical protein